MLQSMLIPTHFTLILMRAPVLGTDLVTGETVDFGGGMDLPPYSAGLLEDRSNLSPNIFNKL